MSWLDLMMADVVIISDEYLRSESYATYKNSIINTRDAKQRRTPLWSKSRSISWMRGDIKVRCLIVYIGTGSYLNHSQMGASAPTGGGSSSSSSSTSAAQPLQRTPSLDDVFDGAFEPRQQRPAAVEARKRQGKIVQRNRHHRHRSLTHSPPTQSFN